MVRNRQRTQPHVSPFEEMKIAFSFPQKEILFFTMEQTFATILSYVRTYTSKLIETAFFAQPNSGIAGPSRLIWGKIQLISALFVLC